MNLHIAASDALVDTAQLYTRRMLDGLCLGLWKWASGGPCTNGTHEELVAVPMWHMQSTGLRCPAACTGGLYSRPFIFELTPRM